MIRRKTAAARFLATTRKDALQTVPTIRQCSRVRFNMQACEFSIFAMYTAPKRSRTTSHRLNGRLSFPDQVSGHRTAIEPWIGSRGTPALSRFFVWEGAV